MKRVIIYAAVYGGIGVVVGVLMALYTKDVSLEQVLTTTKPVHTPVEATKPLTPEETL